MMQHHLTWADFCKLANIRMVDLKKFMSNDGGLRLDQFLSIAEVLGVSAGCCLTWISKPAVPGLLRERWKDSGCRYLNASVGVRGAWEHIG